MLKSFQHQLWSLSSKSVYEKVGKAVRRLLKAIHSRLGRLEQSAKGTKSANISRDWNNSQYLQVTSALALSSWQSPVQARVNIGALWACGGDGHASYSQLSFPTTVLIVKCSSYKGGHEPWTTKQTFRIALVMALQSISGVPAIPKL